MPSRNRAGPIELDDAEKEAADHRARYVADAAEHRRRERLDARNEARIEIDLLVDEAVEHAADAGHAGAEHEGEDDHLVAVDAHQRRRVAVLRHRPHRHSHLCLLDDDIEEQHRDQRGADDDRLDDRDVVAEDDDRALHPFRIGIGADIVAEHAAERVLDDEGGADGADQRRERRDMAERPVADPLDDQRRRGAHRHRQQHDRRHRQDRIIVENAGAIEAARQEEGRERSRHGDVAMREVDQAQDAVDHGVAERDQRIDAADGQAEQEEIEPLVGGVGALDQGADGAAHHHRDHGDAQSPQDDVDEGDLVQAAEHRGGGRSGLGARRHVRLPGRERSIRDGDMIIKARPDTRQMNKQNECRP